jgi:serine/threonine-protein kinase RsbW
VAAEANVRVEVPGELAYRRVLLRTVAATCKVAITRVCGRRAPANGFSHQVVSAVSEAFNNIALHCYRDQPSDIVRMSMTIGADNLQIRMEDYGTSFDPLSAGLPDLKALPESGLGIYIMRSFMDEVTYRPGRPNVLVLRKRIRECPARLPKVSGGGVTDGIHHQ